MPEGLKENDGVMRVLYNQRSQAGAANFMAKTHEGSHILPRRERTRIMEGPCMVVSHNCKVVMNLGLVWRSLARFHQGLLLPNLYLI